MQLIHLAIFVLESLVLGEMMLYHLVYSCWIYLGTFCLHLQSASTCRRSRCDGQMGKGDCHSESV